MPKIDKVKPVPEWAGATEEEHALARRATGLGLVLVKLWDGSYWQTVNAQTREVVGKPHTHECYAISAGQHRHPSGLLSLCADGSFDDLDDVAEYLENYARGETG